MHHALWILNSNHYASATGSEIVISLDWYRGMWNACYGQTWSSLLSLRLLRPQRINQKTEYFHYVLQNITHSVFAPARTNSRNVVKCRFGGCEFWHREEYFHNPRSSHWRSRNASLGKYFFISEKQDSSLPETFVFLALLHSRRQALWFVGYILVFADKNFVCTINRNRDANWIIKTQLFRRSFSPRCTLFCPLPGSRRCWCDDKRRDGNTLIHRMLHLKWHFASCATVLLSAVTKTAFFTVPAEAWKWLKSRSVRHENDRGSETMNDTCFLYS